MIGGWAYNRYTTPRLTGDIDLYVSDVLENQSKLRIVLQKFGFAEFLPPINKPLFSKKIIMLGRAPNRIDLLSAIDGVTFDDAWSEKVRGQLDEIPVWFISLKHLIKNKQSTNREKDVLDVKNLLKSS